FKRHRMKNYPTGPLRRVVRSSRRSRVQQLPESPKYGPPSPGAPASSKPSADRSPFVQPVRRSSPCRPKLLLKKKPGDLLKPNATRVLLQRQKSPETALIFRLRYRLAVQKLICPTPAQTLPRIARLFEPCRKAAAPLPGRALILARTR